MNLPFALPDWLPAWAFLLLALPGLLWALAFLLMPFSVFGVKARLEAMESQIDSLHEEVRNLAIRSNGMLGIIPRNSAQPQTVVEDYGTENLPNFGRIKSTQRSFSETAAAPPIPPTPIIAPTPYTPTPFTPTTTTPPSFTPTIEPREKPTPSKLPQRPPRRMEPRLD